MVCWKAFTIMNVNINLKPINTMYNTIILTQYDSDLQHNFIVEESGFYFFSYYNGYVIKFLDKNKVYATTFPKGSPYRFEPVAKMSKETIEKIKNGAITPSQFHIVEMDCEQIMMDVGFSNGLQWVRKPMMTYWGLEEGEETVVAFSNGMLPQYFNDDDIKALKAGYGVKRVRPGDSSTDREFWL